MLHRHIARCITDHVKIPIHLKVKTFYCYSLVKKNYGIYFKRLITGYLPYYLGKYLIYMHVLHAGKRH